MRGVLLGLALGGCAAVERPVTMYGAGMCAVTGGSAYVGRVADDKLVGQIKRSTGSKVARIVAPGTMVTMDYRSDRVNLAVDGRRVVLKVSCG